MSADSEVGGYLLGAHDPELARLRTQHELWLGPMRDLLDAAGFGAGMRVADLGCGPGWTSLELARRVTPAGSVLGRDRWDRMVHAARALAAAEGVDWIDYECADAAAPFAPASLDGVFARFLFCWLPEPLPVLRAVARGLAPGGRIAVFDYLRYSPDLELTPSGESFDRAIAAVEAAWRGAGGDPRIGERLPALFEEAGLRLVHRREVRLSASPADLLWGWPTSFFPIFVPGLVSNGLLSAEDAERFLDDWRRAAQTPTARFQAPPMLELVAERPA